MATTTSSIERAEDLLPSRPAKEAVSEIAGISLAALFATYVVLSFPGETSWTRLVEVAPEAGAEVLAHIGWGFGVYIPVMLGFYAIVIGGQLVASPAVAARIRRRLGFVSEAMAGALAPAIVLILVACVDDPTKAGSLFVILPVAGVTFFLAVQLGGFVVFEAALRLAEAARSLAWAESRLRELRSHSQRPVWLVATVNVVVGGALGLAVTFLIAPSGLEPVLAAVYAMLAVGLTVVNLHGIHMSLTARDRLSKAAAWLFPVSMALGVLGVVGVLVENNALSGAAGALTVLVVCSLSALWSRRIGWAVGLDWSTRGAGAALAVRDVKRTRTKSVRTIDELSATPTPSSSTGIRERLSAVVLALRGEAVVPTAGKRSATPPDAPIVSGVFRGDER